eukprot:scaffold51687_cov20-Tisochrysis_lutea.AAC.1
MATPCVMSSRSAGPRTVCDARQGLAVGSCGRHLCQGVGMCQGVAAVPCGWCGGGTLWLLVASENGKGFVCNVCVCVKEWRQYPVGVATVPHAASACCRPPFQCGRAGRGEALAWVSQVCSAHCAQTLMLGSIAGRICEKLARRMFVEARLLGWRRWSWVGRDEGGM